MHELSRLSQSLEMLKPTLEHSCSPRPAQKSFDSEEQKMKAEKLLKEPLGWSLTNPGSNPSPTTPYR